ncbi:hypothetical protein GCM10010207_31560 [Streptomyces atratus]|nr:hypothetical protein GCM10010207_31560 [Streptomyces atratus]
MHASYECAEVCAHCARAGGWPLRTLNRLVLLEDCDAHNCTPHGRRPACRCCSSGSNHVYDDALVSVELVSAQVRITQPSEIALYVKAFEQMRQTAVYGAEARALIVKAIDALT